MYFPSTMSFSETSYSMSNCSVTPRPASPDQIPFLSLCWDGKHKAAYEYYKDDHAGGIFAYLRHSAFRFAFESKILRPLLWEYEDDSVAIEKYINILKIEYYMEKLSVALGEGRNNYIPEQYPYVITELGYSLAEVGREEECIEMVEDFMYALYSQTGAAVSVNYLTTEYVARVYLILGEREKSVGYRYNLISRVVHGDSGCRIDF